MFRHPGNLNFRAGKVDISGNDEQVVETRRQYFAGNGCAAQK